MEWVIGVLFVGGLVWFAIKSSNSPTAVAAREKKQAQDAQLMCPHCGTQGQVTSRRIQRKKGISGGKATGAVLTGGISMLGTGLSRKQWVTARRCGNCGSEWDVA